MEIRDLKALVGIAETGSLSKAAHKLNVTQPALSALVRRVEDELSVRILDRHSRGVTLTDEGRYLLERAYVILREVSETAASIHEIAEEPVGRVRIGLPTSVAAGVIPVLVPTVTRLYPGIRLHLVEAMSGSLAELLQLGRVDMAILFDVQPMPGLRSESLLVEELSLLVGAGHPLVTRPAIAFAELAEHDLVLPSGAHSIRQFVDRTAMAEGVGLKVAAEIDSFVGLVRLVKHRYGTILPPHLLADDIEGGTIKRLGIIRPRMSWTLHLAARVDSVRPRSATVVGRVLSETCLGLVASGAWPARPHPSRAA